MNLQPIDHTIIDKDFETDSINVYAHGTSENAVITIVEEGVTDDSTAVTLDRAKLVELRDHINVMLGEALG